MFFSFVFCTFFKIFHVHLGKKVKVLFSRVYVWVTAKLTLVNFFYFFLHLPHRQFSFIDLCLSSKMYWTFNCSWDNVMKWNVFFSFAFCTFFKIFHVRLGKKSKSVSFSRVYVCVKAKLTLVSFFLLFFCTFP